MPCNNGSVLSGGSVIDINSTPLIFSGGDTPQNMICFLAKTIVQATENSQNKIYIFDISSSTYPNALAGFPVTVGHNGDIFMAMDYNAALNAVLVLLQNSAAPTTYTWYTVNLTLATVNASSAVTLNATPSKMVACSSIIGIQTNVSGQNYVYGFHPTSYNLLFGPTPIGSSGAPFIAMDCGESSIVTLVGNNEIGYTFDIINNAGDLSDNTAPFTPSTTFTHNDTPENIAYCSDAIVIQARSSDGKIYLYGFSVTGNVDQDFTSTAGTDGILIMPLSDLTSSSEQALNPAGEVLADVICCNSGLAYLLRDPVTHNYRAIFVDPFLLSIAALPTIDLKNGDIPIKLLCCGTLLGIQAYNVYSQDNFAYVVDVDGGIGSTSSFGVDLFEATTTGPGGAIITLTCCESSGSFVILEQNNFNLVGSSNITTFVTFSDDIPQNVICCGSSIIIQTKNTASGQNSLYIYANSQLINTVDVGAASDSLLEMKCASIGEQNIILALFKTSPNHYALTSLDTSGNAFPLSCIDAYILSSLNTFAGGQLSDLIALTQILSEMPETTTGTIEGGLGCATCDSIVDALLEIFSNNLALSNLVGALQTAGCSCDQIALAIAGAPDNPFGSGQMLLEELALAFSDTTECNYTRIAEALWELHDLTNDFPSTNVQSDLDLIAQALSSTRSMGLTCAQIAQALYAMETNDSLASGQTLANEIAHALWSTGCATGTTQEKVTIIATALQNLPGAPFTCNQIATALGAIGDNTITQITITTALNTPIVTTQPTAQTVCAGGQISLSVAVTGGNGTLTYQWYNGAIAIGTTNPLNISDASIDNAGFYSVTVTDSNGCSVTSDAVPITVNAAPVISVQPQATAICVGAPFTLSVTATGFGTLSYQWYNGETAVGTNSDTYTVNSASSNDAGSYTVVITDSNTPACSITSEAVTVTVNALPVISTPPQSTTICAGSPFTLSVTATGFGTLSYQWYNGETAVGTNSDTYTVNSASSNDAGSYTVVITDSNTPACSVTSEAVTVTVNTLPSVSIANPTTTILCAGAQFTLTANASGGSGTYSTYTWSGLTPTDNATTATPTFTAPDITSATPYSITVTVTDTNGCVSTTSNTISITVNPLPTVNISAGNDATTICAGGTFPILTATPTNNIGTTTYLWQMGNSAAPGVNTESTYSAGSTSATANYSIVMTDQSGCGAVTSAPLTVTVNALPVVTTTSLTAIAGASYSTQLTATTNGVASTYTWSGTFPNTLSLSASGAISGHAPAVANTYFLTVIATDVVTGCQSASTPILLMVAQGTGGENEPPVTLTPGAGNSFTIPAGPAGGPKQLWSTACTFSIGTDTNPIAKSCADMTIVTTDQGNIYLFSSTSHDQTCQPISGFTNGQPYLYWTVASDNNSIAILGNNGDIQIVSLTGVITTISGSAITKNSGTIQAMIYCANSDIEIGIGIAQNTGQLYLYYYSSTSWSPPGTVGVPNDSLISLQCGSITILVGSNTSYTVVVANNGVINSPVTLPQGAFTNNDTPQEILRCNGLFLIQTLNSTTGQNYLYAFTGSTPYGNGISVGLPGDVIIDMTCCGAATAMLLIQRSGVYKVIPINLSSPNAFGYQTPSCDMITCPGSFSAFFACSQSDFDILAMLMTSTPNSAGGGLGCTDCTAVAAELMASCPYVPMTVLVKTLVSANSHWTAPQIAVAVASVPGNPFGTGQLFLDALAQALYPYYTQVQIAEALWRINDMTTEFSSTNSVQDDLDQIAYALEHDTTSTNQLTCAELAQDLYTLGIDSSLNTSGPMAYEIAEALWASGCFETPTTALNDIAQALAPLNFSCSDIAEALYLVGVEHLSLNTLTLLADITASLTLIHCTCSQIAAALTNVFDIGMGGAICCGSNIFTIAKDAHTGFFGIVGTTLSFGSPCHKFVSTFCCDSVLFVLLKEGDGYLLYSFDTTQSPIAQQFVAFKSISLRFGGNLVFANSALTTSADSNYIIALNDLYQPINCIQNYAAGQAVETLTFCRNGCDDGQDIIVINSDISSQLWLYTFNYTGSANPGFGMQIGTQNDQVVVVKCCNNEHSEMKHRMFSVILKNSLTDCFTYLTFDVNGHIVRNPTCDERCFPVKDDFENNADYYHFLATEGCVTHHDHTDHTSSTTQTGTGDHSSSTQHTGTGDHTTTFSSHNETIQVISCDLNGDCANETVLIQRDIIGQHYATFVATNGPCNLLIGNPGDHFKGAFCCDINSDGLNEILIIISNPAQQLQFILLHASGKMMRLCPYKVMDLESCSLTHDLAIILQHEKELVYFILTAENEGMPFNMPFSPRILTCMDNLSLIKNIFCCTHQDDTHNVHETLVLVLSDGHIDMLYFINMLTGTVLLAQKLDRYLNSFCCTGLIYLLDKNYQWTIYNGSGHKISSSIIQMDWIEGCAEDDRKLVVIYKMHYHDAPTNFVILNHDGSLTQCPDCPILGEYKTTLRCEDSIIVVSQVPSQPLTLTTYNIRTGTFRQSCHVYAVMFGCNLLNIWCADGQLIALFDSSQSFLFNSTPFLTVTYDPTSGEQTGAYQTSRLECSLHEPMPREDRRRRVHHPVHEPISTDPVYYYQGNNAYYFFAVSKQGELLFAPVKTDPTTNVVSHMFCKDNKIAIVFRTHGHQHRLYIINPKGHLIVHGIIVGNDRKSRNLISRWLHQV